MNACLIAYTFYENDFRVKRYAEALADAGYKVDVFALRKKGGSKISKFDMITIHHLQGRSYNEKGLKSFIYRMTLFFLRVFYAISVKQFKNRYQIVHVHNPPDFMVFSALSAKIMGAKVIFDMHENLPEFYCMKFDKKPGTFPVKILLLFEKMATLFADYTIVAHDLLKERVISRDGISETKCAALLNYPSEKLFKADYSNLKKENEFRIIYPGTISYLHGLDIAVKAMKAVKNECASIKLDIYGKATSNNYLEEILQLIEDMDLKETVRMHGIVPLEEMRNILLNANVGVVPKRGGIFGSEAFSTKILEFMLAGLPVIVSNTKIDQFYFNSSMVMFFEPENHRELSKRILELYRDAAKRKQLATKSREFVKSNTWEVKSRVYLDIVDELVS